jgi:hypothetical protein
MWIAEEPVVFVHPNGSRREGRIAFGMPYQAEGGETRCPVALDGMDSRGPDIAGESSLQALLLAIRFAAQRISDFRERGGRIVYPATVDDPEPDADFAIEAYFGGLLD